MKSFESFQDPDKMKRLLQGHLPGFSNGSLAISSCKIDYLLLKRSFKEGFQQKASLGVGYLLNVTNRLTQQHGELKLYGKAYLGGRSKRIFNNLPSYPLSPPSFGEPLIHLPDLGMIIWAFPNDPQLRHLPELMDLKNAQKHIPVQACLGQGSCSSGNIQVVSATVVRYKPELRCTIRYDLEWETNNTVKTFSVFAKTFADDQSDTIYQRTEYFWEQSLNDSGEFTVARPLSLNKTIHTIWQTAVSGRPLIEIINRTNFQDILNSVAKGLARFHNSTMDIKTNSGHEDNLEEVRKRLGKIYQTVPEYQNVLQSLLATLEDTATQFPTFQETLIHGDFHMEQLLLSDGKIVLFDFDDLALGDPLQDVADFMAQLHFYTFDPDFVIRMSRSFWQSYRDSVEWGVPTERLDWHMRIHFIRKACREFLQQQPNTASRMEHFLTLARKGVLMETPCSHTLSYTT